MTSLSITGSGRALPKGFKPSLDDVIIGRGKKVVAHNKRFLEIIATQSEAYASATNRVVKSSILALVIYCVQDVRKGNFVKLDTESGLWFVVTDALARSTVAQALRDANSNAYRSSKQFKQRKRQQTKPGTDGNETDGSSASSSGSSSAGLTNMVSAMDLIRASLNKSFRVSVSPKESWPIDFGNADTQGFLQEVLTMGGKVGWDMNAFPGPPNTSQDVSSSTSQEGNFLALLDRTLGGEATDVATNPLEPTPIANSTFAPAPQGLAKNLATPVEDGFIDDLEDLDIREMLAAFQAC